MALYAEMCSCREKLMGMGVTAIAPALETVELLDQTAASAERIKYVFSRKHLRKIRDSRTLAVLVFNRDNHGIPNYIGPNTFAEIAVAFAHYKRIYLFQGYADMYVDELRAWGAVPLQADLRRIADDFDGFERVRRSQPTLFPI